MNKRLRFLAAAFCALLLLTAGCGGSINVHDDNASVKVPPGQIRKEMTPGHTK